MEEEKMEVKLLKEGHKKLLEALDIFKDVDSITQEDYEKLGNFAEKVNDIWIEKKVKLEIMEEC